MKQEKETLRQQEEQENKVTKSQEDNMAKENKDIKIKEADNKDDNKDKNIKSQAQKTEDINKTDRKASEKAKDKIDENSKDNNIKEQPKEDKKTETKKVKGKQAEKESHQAKEKEEANDKDKKEEKKEEKPKELTPEEREALYIDRLKRLMAEFDNYRKRNEKEKLEIYDRASSNLLAEMLPIVDNFERALEAETTDKAFYEGVKMIYKQLMTTLEKAHVKVIEAKGKTFDPNFHNAVMHIEDDSYGENEVVEELQKGYLYKDKVLRYSMVKVAN